jgi:hypothetical protein
MAGLLNCQELPALPLIYLLRVGNWVGKKEFKNEKGLRNLL